MKTALMILALACASAPAFAMGTPVGEIRLHNLGAYAGRTLEVFYVSARPAALGMQGQTLEVREVKAPPVLVQISASGDAIIPATEVPRHGFRTFNYIVFAVPHDASQPLFLRNPDGGIAPDPRVPNGLISTNVQTQADHMSFICYSTLIEKSGGALSAAIDLDALRDL